MLRCFEGKISLGSVRLAWDGDKAVFVGVVPDGREDRAVSILATESTDGTIRGSGPDGSIRIEIEKIDDMEASGTLHDGDKSVKFKLGRRSGRLARRRFAALAGITVLALGGGGYLLTRTNK